jgi:glycerophosphoryl diester phosphodiesterase
VLVRDLTLQQLWEWVASGNPNPQRFPQQRAEATPVAKRFAVSLAADPFFVPTLCDFYKFVDAYENRFGAEAGKTEEQRRRAARVVFDLEIKYVPFHASRYADPALIVERVLQVVQQAGTEARTVIRCFDHRLLKRVRKRCPNLTTAILIAAAAPADPVRLVRDAGASIYCPLFECLDGEGVRECHGEGICVLPWTVNEIDDWKRLLDWGVDGITTDYPDQLRKYLESQHIDWE